MQNLSVVILTHNEAIHIERCIASVASIASAVFVVDSFSTDNTLDLALAQGAQISQHRWQNSYAKQFNWALTHLPITTKWVLRLDADEYLTPELIEEIDQKLPTIAAPVSAIELPLRRLFLGKWIKHGSKKIYLVRLFKYGAARCESRWMDEHLEVLEGTTMRFDHDFADHNLKDLSWWTNKHVAYAVREAADLLDLELNLTNNEQATGRLAANASSKRTKKNRYAKMPLFVRSFAYFCYRYFVLLGFVDGKEGFLWHFMQGWWYRTLVDAKIVEIKRACGNDKLLIKEHLRINYQLDLDAD